MTQPLIFPKEESSCTGIEDTLDMIQEEWMEPWIDLLGIINCPLNLLEEI